MGLKKTKLKNVYINKLTKFEDKRGYVIEYFTDKRIKRFNLKFIQDSFSISNKNVLRGLHGDNKTWKLLTVVFGKAYIIVANNDRYSLQFKEWISFNISDNNYYQILSYLFQIVHILNYQKI